MKSILVLLVLALAAFASAEEVAMGQELAVADAQTAEVADMAVAAEEEEDEEEAVDEAEDEEEAEDEAEDEAEEEEFSLIEAEAEAETDEERKKGKGKKKFSPKKLFKPKKAKGGKRRAKIVRAPRALKRKPWKFHAERIIADTRRPSDPEMEKLDLALAAVKEDILSTNKQITDERKWVIAVAKIIASYNDKMKRVEAHIIALRKEMKSLYRKKKQIENLKLQRALEAKLKEARDELATLSGSLKHVRVKQGELNKSGADLRATIAGIQQQLMKLRGQKLRKPKAAVRGRRCGKGKRYSRKAKRCVARRAGRPARKAGRRAHKGKKF